MEILLERMDLDLSIAELSRMPTLEGRVLETPASKLGRIFDGGYPDNPDRSSKGSRKRELSS